MKEDCAIISGRAKYDSVCSGRSLIIPFSFESVLYDPRKDVSIRNKRKGPLEIEVVLARHVFINMNESLVAYVEPSQIDEMGQGLERVRAYRVDVLDGKRTKIAMSLYDISDLKGAATFFQVPERE